MRKAFIQHSRRGLLVRRFRIAPIGMFGALNPTALSINAPARNSTQAMKKITAAVVGFLAAPLLPAAAVALSTPITADRLDFVYRLGMVPFFYFYSAIATVLFGIPAFLLLRVGLIRWWSTLSAGAIIGLIVATVVPGQASVTSYFEYVLLGTASAWIFWLVWKQGHDPEG